MKRNSPKYVLGEILGEPWHAWGVFDEGGVLDIRTVSPTCRAAIVNWLVLNGHMVLDHWSDETIVKVWQMVSESTKAEVGEVVIQRRVEL